MIDSVMYVNYQHNICWTTSIRRFKESENSVLISSDVSARGIDIPNVDHVIHYQIPRTADLYVHRRGRTARGVSAEGVSVALCGEKENKSFKRILNTLKIGK